MIARNTGSTPALCLLATLLLGGLLIAGENPRFTSLNAALGSARQAKDEQTGLILIDFSATWCGPCQMMKETTFSDAAWRTLSDAPILVEIDVDQEKELALQFEVQAIPSLFLITAEGKVVSRAQGALDLQALTAWIAAGRERLKFGEWEGVSTDWALLQSTQTPQELVAALATTDPSRRRAASNALLTQREKAMAELLKGLHHPYLGVRVACAETIARLAPAAPTFDPWLPASEREASVKAILAWSGKNPILPPAKAGTQRAVSPDQLAAALETFQATEPLMRTRGMCRLLEIGPATLPELARLETRAAKRGDAALQNLIADLRWAILLPPPVELKVRARSELARGESAVRQAAVLRLSSAGEEALPALAALAGDGDSLVRERSIHVLKTIGTPGAIASLTTLLQAEEANLRMIAAQAIGQTKEPKHAALLTPALTDPDEVVACTAIAAIEEVGAKKQWALLRPCLKDPRWRVRAAAAEMLGKMEAPAGTDLRPLIDDPDPFVINKTLLALREIKKSPAPKELLALAKRRPEVAGAVAELLAKDDESSFNLLYGLSEELPSPHREVILDALAGLENEKHHTDRYWIPLLNQLARSESLADRNRLLAMLHGRSATLARRYLAHLLGDPEAKIRLGAAREVIHILAFAYGLSGRPEASGFGRLVGQTLPSPTPLYVALARELPKDPKSPKADTTPLVPVTEAPPTPETQAVAGLFLNALWGKESRETRSDPAATALAPMAGCLAVWHENLAKLPERATNPTLLWAWYLTGDGNEGFKEISAWILAPTNRPTLQGLEADRMLGLLLAKLPWPEGEALLDHLLADPELYAGLRPRAAIRKGVIGEKILAKERLLAHLATPELERIQPLLHSLLQRAKVPVSLLSPYQYKLQNELRASTPPLARALGVFALAERKRLLLADLTPFRKDPSPWVRRAMVQAAVMSLPSQSDRATLLTPLLEDPEPTIPPLAAVGLLQNGLLRESRVSDLLSTFHFGPLQLETGLRYASFPEGSIAPIAAPPAVIARIEALAAPELAKEESPLRMPLLLLLTQAGVTAPLDQEIDAWLSGARKEHDPDPLLAALPLHKSPKMLTLLGRMVEKSERSYQLRSLLAPLAGVRGKEARALRRTINVRMRELEAKDQ